MSEVVAGERLFTDASGGVAEPETEEAAAVEAEMKVYLAEITRLQEEIAADHKEIVRERQATRRNLREIRVMLERLRAA